MGRSLAFLLPAEFKGENRGVYVQHVESMRWLLEPGGGWTIRTAALDDPECDRIALDSDVAVVHMLAHRKAEGIIRARRARGRPTVFEMTDNFLALGGWLPDRHPLRSPLARQQILFHAWLCGSLQVYSPPLARLFGAVSRRIALFDPYVPQAPRRSGASSGRFVLGWAGTTSHAEDLARIAPAVLAFCAVHPNALFAFMGDSTLFETHFAALPADQARFRRFAEYEEYLAFVRTWDVGLAPIGRDGFSNARTDTKAATYAACGVAPLLERHAVHAAHEGHALFFADADELSVQLEALHSDRRRTEALGRAAYAWSSAERGAERLRRQRADFYESLLAGSPAAPPEAEPEPAAAISDALERSPIEGLRRSHREWERRNDFLRAMLEEQPFDYVALRSVIAEDEANGANGADGLGELYERLCLLAPEAVPAARRPARLDGLLPQ